MEGTGRDLLAYEFFTFIDRDDTKLDGVIIDTCCNLRVVAGLVCLGQR